MRRLLQVGIVAALLAAVMTGCDRAPHAEPMPGPAPATGPGAVASSLDGIFTVDSIDDFLDIVSVTLITPWFQDTWQDVAPPQVRFVPAGQSGTQGCAFDDESLAFCADVQTVYVGQTALWDLYSQAGDAAAAVRLAYEFGRSQTGDPTVAYCLAGTWVRYADDHGWLETDDEQDIEALLQLTAATDLQRGSLQTGRADGVSACRVAQVGRT